MAVEEVTLAPDLAGARWERDCGVQRAGKACGPGSGSRQYELHCLPRM